MALVLATPAAKKDLGMTSTFLSNDAPRSHSSLSSLRARLPSKKNIRTDMKHSRNWRCEFCTKSARETVWMNASWMHLPEPRANSYVHHVCDAAIGPCADKLRAVDAEMARMSGLPPTGSLPPVPKPKGTKFPMSSSCAVCNNETSESRKSLKQCAKCQLTRYCSVECQRSDWPRHKACCKVVKEVKWIWN
ncbi:hypothetical protein C8F04DRAFT_1128054 [Mycena alexandri]|uniref:MYND-type domain-containing protein n=1 Tax=Mycena alexandri TaxID=1745969 RepID=A0AAD6SEL2_9AGAR|nr:hypothetical protein C8F04DRAFT_1128054 [Mycena alexandri]